MTPLRILIAEDHLIARVGIATIVNAQPDMQVVAEAAGGQQAIEQHALHKPDVTLMDIRMPGVDGIAAIEAIRRDSPQARIVALSTYGGAEDVRRALSAGALAYLTKEVLHDELLAAIRCVYAGKSYVSAGVAAAVAAQWPNADLSSREAEVLTLIVRGMSNKDIAHALGIAEYTVKNHVKNILAKLRVDDRTQAAIAAVERGIVHLG